MTRFNKERFQILDLHITTIVSVLTYAIKCEAFKMSLSKTPPKLVTEVLVRAEKYINMEETMAPRRKVSSSGKFDQKRPHESNLRQDAPRVKLRQDPSSTSFTHLNTSRSNILMEIKDSKELKWPPRLRSPPDTRDKNKYYDFHQDHGHTTEDCFTSKREIETLIKRRFLGSYVCNDKHPRNNQNRDKAPEGRGNKQPTAGIINIIFRGATLGKDSSSRRKQYARQPSTISKSDLGSTEDITFGARDLEGI
ncbi:uncharacterized protein LOC111369266 [Olea europaea var. sylvestris]|uniref:uncharacterized protein LOC111369266 n=1 Tax=Olea europaea var. sylvestris TaxID=158386 RepID=UPI000C1CFE24|nr:uncharacterized protein LOC111369266 [Olea europaea var. sylvestris]